MNGKYHLAEHQVYAEFMMECNDALGIFYEAGTGKTMIALSRAYHALERGEIDSFLVVCPASLVTNWENAVDKMLEFEGYTEEGVERLREAMTVVSFQKTYLPRKNTSKLTLRPDVDRRWGMTVIDEAHALGAHNSVQTRACLTLGRLSKYRYALTGTPVSGGGGKPDYKKLYGIIKFLHPDIWRNWTEFCSIYVASFDRYYKPRTYHNERCEELMRYNAIMARLRDCYDMPAETHEYLDCPLEEIRVYEDIRRGRVKPYNLDIDVAGRVYPKLLQVCSGSLITNDGVKRLKCSKDQALIDLLNGTDDAVVIFCNYSASVDRCVEIATACGRETVAYDGHAMSGDWMRFQLGTANCIVCQYQKGGVGIDLFKSATTIYYEPCWSFLQLEQSKARTMRKGQSRSCRFIYLRTPRTREADAWELVRNGADLTDAVFERWAATEGAQRK